MEWVAVLITLAAMVVMVLLFIRQRARPIGTPTDLFQRLDTVRSDLQSQIGSLRTDFLNNLNSIRQELGQNVQGVQTALSTSGQTLKDVGMQLGALMKAAEQIQKVGENIAELQEILSPPKLRGELGEYLLENLLAQCLPKECYRLQHLYSDGSRVDALICLAQGSIPVDSKFPLESFRSLLAAQSEEEAKKLTREFVRDVQKVIDQAAAYIRPAEGTLDFALMYIPAENIYYEVAVKSGPFADVMRYAMGKRVFLVSPNTFYTYLQAIALGLRGLQIEQRAREIYAQLAGVQQQLQGFQEKFEVVGRHIRNALDRYNEANLLLGRAQAVLSSLSTKPEKTALPPGEAP